MYELLISILGIVVTTYVAAFWVLHSASAAAWSFIFLMLAISFFVVIAAWVRLTWAPHLLAVTAGLGTAMLFSSYIDVLLP